MFTYSSLMLRGISHQLAVLRTICRPEDTRVDRATGIKAAHERSSHNAPMMLVAPIIP
jgi:hypothetical protein